MKEEKICKHCGIAIRSDAAYCEWCFSNLLNPRHRCHRPGCEHDEAKKKAKVESVGEPPRAEPPTLATPVAAMLDIRDALLRDDVAEAYHLLYTLAEPTFTEREPWKKWEELAGSRPSAPSQFSDAENAAIRDLAQRLGVSEFKVLQMAVREYQLKVVGVPDLGDKAAPAPDLDDPETWKGIEQSYETAPAPSGEPQSRSIQRRVALQKGETMPTFESSPVDLQAAARKWYLSKEVTEMRWKNAGPESQMSREDQQVALLAAFAAAVRGGK